MPPKVAKYIAGLKARGLKAYGQPEQIAFAIDFELADAESGRPYAGRYTRTAKAICDRFGCHRSTAFHAMAAARAYRMDQLADRMPSIAADLIDQWQEIADKATRRGAPGDYGAAVASLREIGKVAGVYAPIKVEVEHTERVEVALEIDVTLSVLDENDHAALRKIAEKIEAARAAGRLPEREEDEIEDAVIVPPVTPGDN